VASGTRETDHEAHFSAEQPASSQDARLSNSDEHARRAHGSEAPKDQRPQAPGGVTSDERFRPLDRIRKRSEYQAIYDRGRRIPSASFVLFVQRNGLGRPRLGITVTRRLGGAVKRNRAKRLIREVFRRHKTKWKSVDIVVNGRPGLHRLSFVRLEAELLERLRPYQRAS
jgi:ribonuclease P protein component